MNLLTSPKRLFSGLILAVALLATLPAVTAQEGGNSLCVNAPQNVAKGDTEAIAIEIELGGSPREGWACTEITEIQDVMGVGLSGTRSNFELEPPESYEEAGMQNPGVNQWAWNISAVGDENTSHNLIAFAAVPDPTRRVGYRSVALLPLRVTILEPTGSVFDQILRFLNNTKEILLVLSAVIVAAVALRSQIAGMLKGKEKPNTEE